MINIKQVFNSRIRSIKSKSAGTVVLNNKYHTDLYNWNRDGGLSETFLGRGINLGNFLDSPKSLGGEGSYNNNRKIVKDFFGLIRDAGFKTVRIPIRWSDYASELQPFSLNSSFMNRVTEVLDWALEYNLTAIINVHHYFEMMNYYDKHSLDYHRQRLVEIWKQICNNIGVAKYPASKVLFEILNEPFNRVTYQVWNDIISELVPVIFTATNQTDRKIVIGTADLCKITGLKKLRLPDICSRDNTIIAVHFYDPFKFTHQGADWVENAKNWIGKDWTGRQSQCKQLIKLFKQMEKWNSGNDRKFEVFISEFGAYSKYIAESQQAAWTAFVAREAEKRHFSWAYWEFCSLFGVYDLTEKKWRPHLLNALIPAEKV